MRRQPYRFTVTKSPGNAEQISIEGEWDGSESGWAEHVAPVLARLDGRMHEMNMRMLNGARQLRTIDPKAADAAATVCAMVNGIELQHVGDLDEVPA